MNLQVFLVAFAFSFLGSIPPGTINLSVLQLSLSGRMGAALRFCLAAAVVEYPYAYIALRFEKLITETPLIQNHFHLISALVMIFLGILGLYAHKSDNEKWKNFQHSGFRKGVIISLLNPLAIPFWIGVTAYLKNEEWVVLSSELDIHLYVFGVSAGTFVLLAVLSLLSSYIGERFRSQIWLQKLPFFIFLGLGTYSLFKFFIF